jgi:hypothetical protein
MCWFVHSGARSCGMHRLLQTFGVRTTMIGTRCSRTPTRWLPDRQEMLGGRGVNPPSTVPPAPLRGSAQGTESNTRVTLWGSCRHVENVDPTKHQGGAIVFVVAARMNVRQLAQILCSSHKLLLDSRFSGSEAISANPPACFAIGLLVIALLLFAACVAVTVLSLIFN